MATSKSQAIKFKEVIRHGTFQLMPNVPFAFEDPDAVPYFTALNWTENTDETPVYIFTQDEISIDPLTTIAETGKPVLPEKAEAIKAAQASTEGVE